MIKDKAKFSFVFQKISIVILGFVFSSEQLSPFRGVNYDTHVKNIHSDWVKKRFYISIDRSKTDCLSDT